MVLTDKEREERKARKKARKLARKAARMAVAQSAPPSEREFALGVPAGLAPSPASFKVCTACTVCSFLNEAACLRCEVCHNPTAKAVQDALGNNCTARDCTMGAHAGLVNQGATCYMNSLLQLLYACVDFRCHVFAARGCGPVTAALQALFAELLLGARGAASTVALTRAFGWRDREVYVQHDASEALVVLLAALQQEALVASPAGGSAAAAARAAAHK
jgi:hypothetical protein